MHFSIYLLCIYHKLYFLSNGLFYKKKFRKRIHLKFFRDVLFQAAPFFGQIFKSKFNQIFPHHINFFVLPISRLFYVQIENLDTHCVGLLSTSWMSILLLLSHDLIELSYDQNKETRVKLQWGQTWKKLIFLPYLAYLTSKSNNLTHIV